MSKNSVRHHIASDDLAAITRAIIQDQMAATLRAASIDLTDDEACVRILVASGFGSASIAELSSQARSMATAPARISMKPTPRGPCKPLQETTARRAAQ